MPACQAINGLRSVGVQVEQRGDRDHQGGAGAQPDRAGWLPGDVEPGAPSKQKKNSSLAPP